MRRNVIVPGHSRGTRLGSRTTALATALAAGAALDWKPRDTVPRANASAPPSSSAPPTHG
ncbi:hypothetical protein [Actinomadura harenae]|uniref:Uncharacterized protein n=1 Tax=Actinomadura harenae TaxID=2483351 RepID=A0A3M2MCD1_9ACTN|nr:hypothetical protein [Actinomadura harenae]RMI47247.1 hypothetical protein EBO15_03420 [Actinomadura harenae]